MRLATKARNNLYRAAWTKGSLSSARGVQRPLNGHERDGNLNFSTTCVTKYILPRDSRTIELIVFIFRSGFQRTFDNGAWTPWEIHSHDLVTWTEANEKRRRGEKRKIESFEGESSALLPQVFACGLITSIQSRFITQKPKSQQSPISRIAQVQSTSTRTIDRRKVLCIPQVKRWIKHSCSPSRQIYFSRSCPFISHVIVRVGVVLGTLESNSKVLTFFKVIVVIGPVTHAL